MIKNVFFLSCRKVKTINNLYYHYHYYCENRCVYLLSAAIYKLILCTEWEGSADLLKLF
jgi:hypothetical protein